MTHIRTHLGDGFCRYAYSDPVLGCYVNPEYREPPRKWGWGMVAVEPCEGRPRGHGVVYRDLARNVIVSAPIPLNVLYRACYLGWGWLVYPWRGERWWEKRRRHRWVVGPHTNEHIPDAEPGVYVIDAGTNRTVAIVVEQPGANAADVARRICNAVNGAMR